MTRLDFICRVMADRMAGVVSLGSEPKVITAGESATIERASMIYDEICERVSESEPEDARLVAAKVVLGLPDSGNEWRLCSPSMFAMLQAVLSPELAEFDDSSMSKRVRLTLKGKRLSFNVG